MLKNLFLIIVIAISFTGNYSFAQTSVSAWEFYCKYLANAINCETNNKQSYTTDLDHSLSHQLGGYSKIFIKYNLWSCLVFYKGSSQFFFSKNANLTNNNSYSGISIDFNAKGSIPYFGHASINLNMLPWAIKYHSAGPYDSMSTLEKLPKLSRNGSSSWELSLNNFQLEKQIGDTYTFSVKTDLINFESFEFSTSSQYFIRHEDHKLKPYFVGKLILTIPSSTLANTDEFGKWEWNTDKSQIWVNSTGNLWNSNEIQFKIIRDGNSLQFVLDGTAAAFGSPASNSNGYKVYELDFSFGDTYQTLKFLDAGESTLGKRLIYGSYNRFTGESNTDGGSVLQQFKCHKYCVMKVGEDQNIQSYVFPLEGLETLIDYIN